MSRVLESTVKSGLSLDYRPKEVESEVREFWERMKIPEKLRELREKENVGELGWYEGPPTLNGTPHVGHARGRVIKDLRYRFRSMQGYLVPFWAGWDTQGLPVELEAEKELGVKNKKELLERVGEERFVEECKKIIKKYYSYWESADKKLGVFIDHERAYWTYKDEYIEREWQYLKRAWEQGLLGEGYYIVAYCPSCQTSLSNAEAGLGYKEVEDPSVYFKFKVAGSENEYFVVWTTMPFTIVTDLMLAVHPDHEYAKVKVGDEVWIMADRRVEPLMEELGIEDYVKLGKVLGRELEGVKYEYPFLDLVPKQREFEANPKVHTVVAEDFVDVESASGVVHLAPGNGEEDFLVAQKRGVPIFVPYDDEVKFTSDAGAFSGLFARDADEKVIDELRKRGLLIECGTVRHEYPTCWRSHHKLIWVARKEYYIWTDRINDKILEAAGKVKYFFEGPKNRFISFLSERKPWCISRERVWGTPLPIWVCEKCGHKTLVSSKKELLEKAIEKPEGYFELHKPWIDRFILKCEKCGSKMRRVPYVIDCWFDSGAAPYSRFTDEDFKRFVPAEFLVEAIDQTRGWANSLLLEHVILTGEAESPYRSFLFYGFTLDDKGRKMSKSLGNVVEVNPLLDRYSADLCRFYLLWKTSPVDSMIFDVNDLSKRPYQVLSTLYHLNRFFLQNAEYDGFDPSKYDLDWALKSGILRPPDRWLLSKLQGLIEKYTELLESCEFNSAMALLDDFIVGTLSRNYVPMVRRDLWSDDPKYLDRRLTIYAVLWETLNTLLALINPATPFISEYLYQKVIRSFKPDLPESINFLPWPKPRKDLWNETLERDFENLLRCVSLVYSARQKAGMKRRWPLRRVYVVAPREFTESVMRLESVFLELANVKEAFYLEDPSGIEPEYLDGCVDSAEDEVQVYLYVRRDEALVSEGLMRDLARRVQALRKDLGYVPTDILESVRIAGLEEGEVEMLKGYSETMLGLVRAKKIEFLTEVEGSREGWHKSRLDGRTIYINIK